MKIIAQPQWMLDLRTSFIKRIIAEAGSNIVSIEFVKLDGTKRQICFNPRDTQEVKGTGTPSSKPNIIRCRDFTIARKGEAAWRSFDCERVTRIASKGMVRTFQA